MKINNDLFELKSNKLKKDLTICLFADIHNTKYIKYDLYTKIIYNIKKQKPDLILIPGDLIYTADDLIDLDNQNKLTYLFKGLISIAPTIVSIGNHDLKNGKILNYKDTMNFLKKFEKENLGLFYILENDLIEVGGVNIVAVSPSFETYYMKYRESWNKYFIDALNSINKDIKNNYTVFMTHSPETLIEVENTLKDSKSKVLNSKSYKIINNSDLFLCGHCHDGFVPKHWQKLGIIKGDKGICASEGDTIKEATLRIVSKCRGIHNIYNGKLIITGGITKWPHPNLITSFINNFWAKDVTVIKIRKTK